MTRFESSSRYRLRPPFYSSIYTSSAIPSFFLRSDRICGTWKVHTQPRSLTDWHELDSLPSKNSVAYELHYLYTRIPLESIMDEMQERVTKLYLDTGERRLEYYSFKVLPTFKTYLI